jgi:ferrous iron transport protein B
MNIALAGNPNCGKTSLFNLLTGRREKIGNWAGVTVSHKMGRLKYKYSEGNRIFIIDLPGAYSLDAYTSDETVAIDYLKSQKIDVIINVIDVTDLERNLYLTLALLESDIPVIIALNKSDLMKRHKMTIDINTLESRLDAPVFQISASKKDGLVELMEKAKTIGFKHKGDVALGRQKI